MFGKKNKPKDGCKCTTKDLSNANTSNTGNPHNTKASDMTSGSRSTKSCSGKSTSAAKSCSTKSCSGKSTSKTKSCS